MIPLDLSSLDPDFYTGNCHKWMCAPKGAAFLYVKRDLQPSIHPAVISHGFNARSTKRTRFELEFGWTGTGDPTAYLSVPAAIDTMASIIREHDPSLANEGEAWRAIMQRNRSLVLDATPNRCERARVAPPVPESMVGSIATLDLPARDEPPAPGSTRYHDPMQNELLDRFGIQVPIVPWPDRGVLASAGLDHTGTGFGRAIRLSAQLYNDPTQYAYLAETLVQVVGRAQKA